MKKKLILILSILILTGCSNDLTKGEVIDKEYNPAYRQLVLMPVHIYNGKTSTMIMVPYWIFHEENWKIEIKCIEKDCNTKQTYYITEKLYNEIKIGDIYEYNEKTDLKKEPTFKTKEKDITQEQLEQYEEK